jgi:hypothetical protein
MISSVAATDLMSVFEFADRGEPAMERVVPVDGAYYSRLTSEIFSVMSELNSDREVQVLLFFFVILGMVSFGAAGWYGGASYGIHQQRLSVNC